MLGCDKISILCKEMIEPVLDDMVWSFSRLNGFYTCKRSWYLQYISLNQSKPNFFSDYGLFNHSIFEKYDKGELQLFELLQYYENNFYEEVKSVAPPNRYVDLSESYFNKAYDYWENFEGHDDETIGVEVRTEFKLNIRNKERTFVGYIDRLSKDDKGYIVTDYKSRSKFKNKQELNLYLIQLYMYALGVKEQYDEYPYKLKFILFKENMCVDVDFDLEQLQSAIDWIDKTINLIYNEEVFPPKTENKENDFFCKYLCGVHELC